MKNMDPTMAAILLGAGVAIFTVFGFSRSIGANFQVTLAAVGYSIGVIVILAVLYWTPLKPSISISSSVAAATLWPAWWKVIDSIAHGGANPDALAFRFPQEVWWNTNAFKYGLEAGLIALAVFVVIRQLRDPYGY